MLKALELPKLSNKLGLEEPRANWKQEPVETIMDKIFKTNSSFHVKKRMESLNSIFQEIF